MHLDDRETELLKTWIIKRLEYDSDADADILADYVLALVKNDGPEVTLRANCVEQLNDFLPDNAPTFVDDVFKTIKTKAYDPSYRPALVPVNAPSSRVGVYQPSRRVASAAFPLENQRAPNQSRKRSYNGSDAPGGPDGSRHDFGLAGRPTKSARRGGVRNGLGSGPAGHQQPQSWLHSNQVQPALPSFDLTNPMAIMQAMQSMQRAMGLPDVPGMPPLQSPHSTAGLARTGSGQRCRDYDTKGFCSLGGSCPHEHGNDPVIVPSQDGEYDPFNATLLHPAPTRTGSFDLMPQVPSGKGNERGRGRGRGIRRGGKTRADFSMTGQNHNRSTTSIVVEQIPEDFLNDEAVNDFFAQFGNVESVDVQTHKSLAILKFDSYDAAKAAYESPKVVFDNRFVKVYWLRSMSGGQHNGQHPRGSSTFVLPEHEEEEPSMDAVELAKRQEEAQRKHEMNQKALAEAEKQRAELEEKVRAMDAERKMLNDLLAAKAKKVQPGLGDAENRVEIQIEESEQTKGLKAMLAKLEAEAKELGIDPKAATDDYHSIVSYQGGYRQGFRGKGAFARRGRGGYRNRWAIPAIRGGSFGGAVRRLDNRPKTVCVVFADGTANHESMNEFLLVKSLEPAVSPHPDRDDALLARFEERYLAEIFMTAAAGGLPKVGKAELSWYGGQQNSAPSSIGSSEAVKIELGNDVTNGNGNMEMDRTEQDDMYDVADDQDRWE